MSFNNTKYSKIISTITLSAYLILFFTNVIHHHTIKLNSEYSFKVSNILNSTNHFSNYSGFNCPVHNYFSSVHSVVLQEIKGNNILQPEISVNKIYSNSPALQQTYNSIQLRAPPIVFF
jgi:hypothetical protein